MKPASETTRSHLRVTEELAEDSRSKGCDIDEAGPSVSGGGIAPFAHGALGTLRIAPLSDWREFFDADVSGPADAPLGPSTFEGLNLRSFAPTATFKPADTLRKLGFELLSRLELGRPARSAPPVIAPRADPKRSSVAARFHALSGDALEDDRATDAPRGKGWAILAKGLGLSLEALTEHPKVRRAIALAAASNGQPSILSEVEAKMLLRELDESTKLLARLRPVREAALPANVRGVQIGPFAHRIDFGDFEGTVRVRGVSNGVVRPDEAVTKVEAPKHGFEANVQQVEQPVHLGEETQLTFESHDGAAVTVRMPRRSLTSGAGSAGYRTLDSIPGTTAYVHD